MYSQNIKENAVKIAGPNGQRLCTCMHFIQYTDKYGLGNVAAIGVYDSLKGILINNTKLLRGTT